MSYESEERLMVQGIENDARRWPEHGEIPPDHDELVSWKKHWERQRMLKEVAESFLKKYGRSLHNIGIDELEIAYFIKNWKPRGE